MARLPLPERPGHASGREVAEIRWQTAEAIAARVWRTDPEPRELVLAGVRALSYPASQPRGTVLHFHGGGYRIGCAEMMAPFATALAARCSVDVVCPDYRLAPDFPFPAALNDGWACWTAVHGRGPLPVIVSGDSAGGGIAAALVAQAAASGAPPTGVVLLSPWLDLSVAGASYSRNAASDPVFSAAAASAAAADYLQGHPASDPLASPILADLTGYPPTFVSAGRGEVLVDDAVRFHAALGGAAPHVLSVIPEMEHVAVTRGFDRVGASETFGLMTQFIDGLIGPPATA